MFEFLTRDKYEKGSSGWGEEKKSIEWRNPKSRSIMVIKNDTCDASEAVTFGQLPENDDEIIGFERIRYERGAEKDECALYSYELH